jgi:hypothetical protein
MMRFSTVRIAMLFLAFTACTLGEVEGPDGDGSGSDSGSGSGSDNGSGSGGGNGQAFTAMVSPLVTECIGCHRSGGTAPDLTSFMGLGAEFRIKPGANSRLVMKGEHSGVPALTPAEKTIVATWIDGVVP